MTTYADLFKVLKAGGTIWAEPNTETARKIDVLWRLGIVETGVNLKDEKWRSFLHPRQVARMAQKQAKAPISAIPSAVMVNWSRGFSGTSYPVLAHGKLGNKPYLVLNISTDENKVMLKGVLYDEKVKAA